MRPARISEYYEKTYNQYRGMWTGRDTLACHFGWYDARARTHAHALIRTNERVAELAGIGPGDRVLDAGCGLGGTALWLAEARGAEVVGVSLSPRQVERARRAARERGLEARVRFEVADFAATGEPGGSVDAVIALESLCHSADKAAFMAEAARVLRPGGRLVVADYMRVRAPGGPAEARLLEAWYEGWAISPLAAPDELAALAGAAGLTDARAADVTAHMAPSLRRLYRLTYPGWVISWGLRAVRLNDRVGHLNVIASRRQYQALRRGLWRYFHLTARKP